MDRKVIDVSSLSLSFCLFLWLYLPTYPRIYLCIHLSLSLSVCLFMSLSIYLSTNPSVCLSIYLPVYLQAWKRSYSARPPQCLNLITSKTKQFCETSSCFKVDNINKQSDSARLLHFSKLTTSRTKQFCETSFKSGKLRAALTASYQCVLRFFQSICLNYCACHENWCLGHTKCCTCHARSSQQTWRSDLQNATPLRKSAPGPPNSSDEHVSCTAPATENASLQILLKFPTPAIVFWKCYRTLTFCSLLTRSTIPCACHAKWHLVLLTFDKVHNPLRLPCQMTSEPPKVVRTWCVLYILTSKCASRHFSTSQLPKVVRAWCALYILTSKCASRHNGVHFFDISTSKSGPRMVCFVHFDFDMCFAPQRRAVFHLSSGQMAPHPPLQRAYFSTLRSLKTLEKHSVSPIRDFPTFSRTYIFFLLTLSLLWSSLFYSSLLWLFPSLLLICPYCRKFDF